MEMKLWSKTNWNGTWIPANYKKSNSFEPSERPEFKIIWSSKYIAKNPNKPFMLVKANREHKRHGARYAHFHAVGYFATYDKAIKAIKRRII